MSLDSTPTPPETATTPETIFDTPPAGTQTLTLSPFYHSAVNAITEPDKYVPCSRYFLRRWGPLLGSFGIHLVLTLRSLGYNNRKTGERRDAIEIDLVELAGLLGVHRTTILRELGDKKGQPGVPANPALHQFVKKDRQYWRDPVTGALLRTANIYRVAMDDPLHEDDIPRLDALLKEMEATRQEPKSQIATKPPRNRQVPADPKSQNATQSVQIATEQSQNATALKETLEMTKNTTQKDRTLNVSTGLNGRQVCTEELPDTQPQPSEPLVRVNEYDLIQNKQVQALVEELRDFGSERRHRQLLDICARHRLDSLPHQALRATRKRLAEEGRHGALEHPGAYYQRVLVTLLEQHQVFVPTQAAVADLRAELGLPADAIAEDIHTCIRASLPPPPDRPRP